MTERLLRARDVAERLDVSVETVLRLHRAGKLPGGRRLSSSVLRFDAQEIEAWLDERRGRPPSSSLASGITSGILSGITSSTREET